MALHENFQDLAVRLIGKNGRPVTISRETFVEDSVEPWKKSAGTTTTSTSSTTAVFFDNRESDLVTALRARTGEDLTTIQESGTFAWFPAKGLSFAPEPKDQIIDGDTTWEILDVQMIGPGPTPVVYICKVNK